MDAIAKEILKHRTALLFERRASGRRFNCDLVEIGSQVNGNTILARQIIYDEYGKVTYRLPRSISIPSVFSGDTVLLYPEDL